MAKKYKCPYCDKYHEREKLITHIQDKHDDLIPETQTPTQVVFNHINKKTHGTCVICKKPTEWNEKAGRYDRICSDKCREKMREDFKKNSMAKHGTYNFTADPEFQEKMLKGRKISSTYTFTDGGKIDYVGSYEKKFLEFVDKVMEIDSKDIISPGPTIEYIYNGEKHFWITDFYYVPGNLVLDIKDGGKNPNKRPMEEYREKQVAKEAAIKRMKKYNYLRLTDNNFLQFMEVLADLKFMALDIKETQLINRINESTINESVFVSKDDIYWNFDKFENSKSNILLITGLSGSGKSTLGRQLSKKYNAEYIELDIFDSVTRKKKHPLVQAWLDTLSDSDIQELNKEPYTGEWVPKFVDYIIKYAKSNNDKKFIIEGIQIYDVYKDKARQYPLIIKGTSVIKSFIQKVKRDQFTYKEFLQDSGEILKWLIKSDEDLNKIRKSLNESYIEELSAAMSTVPPMYSSDASVLISVDKNRGDERIALSSLDFNDKLLLDDEIDGIVKISKEKYKEKYTIKEQFLVKKDESYYNLLQAFKNKDACIYEGIYKNLSSFDYVLTESQIYLDKKFTKIEKDITLEKINESISKVNECVFVIGESTFIRNDKLDLEGGYIND